MGKRHRIKQNNNDNLIEKYKTKATHFKHKYESLKLTAAAVRELLLRAYNELDEDPVITEVRLKKAIDMLSGYLDK